MKWDKRLTPRAFSVFVFEFQKHRSPDFFLSVTESLDSEGFGPLFCFELFHSSVALPTSLPGVVQSPKVSHYFCGEAGAPRFVRCSRFTISCFVVFCRLPGCKKSNYVQMFRFGKKQKNTLVPLPHPRARNNNNASTKFILQPESIQINRLYLMS